MSYLKYLLKKNIKPTLAVIFITTIFMLVSIKNISKTVEYTEYNLVIYSVNKIGLSYISLFVGIISVLLGLYIRYPFLSKALADSYLSFPINKQKIILYRYISSIIAIFIIICALVFVSFISSCMSYGISNLNCQYFLLYIIEIFFYSVIILTISSSVLSLATNILDAIVMILFVFLAPVLLTLLVQNLNIPNNGFIFSKNTGMHHQTFFIYETISDFSYDMSSNILLKLNKKNSILGNYQEDHLNYLRYIVLPRGYNLLEIPTFIMMILFGFMSYFSNKEYRAEDIEDVNTSNMNYLILLSITIGILVMTLFKEGITTTWYLFIITLIAGLVGIVFFKRELKINKKEIIILSLVVLVCGVLGIVCSL